MHTTLKMHKEISVLYKRFAIHAPNKVNKKGGPPAGSPPFFILLLT
jgi:hypothetical protein